VTVPDGPEGKNPVILRIKNLSKGRGPNYQLHIPELEIKAGAKIFLVGESGSGKSTTLDILALVLAPDRAENFTWRPEGDKTDLQKVWSRGKTDVLTRLRREDMGYVLQTGGLLPFLTVQENILLSARLKKMDKSSQDLEMANLIPPLRLGNILNKYPHQISVGERQRCAIARAVITRPLLILADEPTASLDPQTADHVFTLLLAQAKTSALVVASHDTSRALNKDFTALKVTCYNPTDGGEPIQAKLGPTKL